MQYFEAVQTGRIRVTKAVDLLRQVVGPSSPVLFLKMNTKDWIPVGDENLLSVVPGKESTAAIVLCDSEGNAKAISGWFPKEAAERHAQTLKERGLANYEGEVRLPI